MGGNEGTVRDTVQDGEERPAIVDDVRRRMGRYVEEHALFRGVDRALVACSAGGDSTALLDLLTRLGGAGRAPGERGLGGAGDRDEPLDPVPQLAVCHLDHGWRPGSAADAAHVTRTAEALGYESFVERAELPPPGSGSAAGSAEATARAARHDFFRRTAAGWRADAVVLGHTRDDQAETLLFNLARGTGRRGLAGMAPRTRVEGLVLLRPLLAVGRAELRDYAAARGLEWREDPSNEDLALARNRVRHEVLPRLEEVNPAATANLARAAELLRSEEAWLSEVVETLFEASRRDDAYPGAVALDVAALEAQPAAARRRVVRRALRAVRGDLRDVERSHVDAVVDRVLPGEEAARDLPGVRVRLDGAVIRLLPLDGRQLASPARSGQG